MEGQTPAIIWLLELGACGLFVASAVSDLRYRVVPNSISLSLLGLFFVYAVTGGVAPPGHFLIHLGISLFFLVIGFAFYMTGRFGGGDAKLMAVAGLWVGPSDMIVFLFWLAVGSFSLCLIALLPFTRSRPLRSELPFAVAIVPSAVIVMIARALSH